MVKYPVCDSTDTMVWRYFKTGDLEAICYNCNNQWKI